MKFGMQASPDVIRRAEEQARNVPKSLAFNLLNILVDPKVQAESNISGVNGKRPLDKNILGAIQCKLIIINFSFTFIFLKGILCYLILVCCFRNQIQ